MNVKYLKKTYKEFIKRHPSFWIACFFIILFSRGILSWQFYIEITVAVVYGFYLYNKMLAVKFSFAPAVSGHAFYHNVLYSFFITVSEDLYSIPSPGFLNQRLLVF